MTGGSLPGTVKKTASDVTRLAKLKAELAKQRIQKQAKRKAIFAGLAGGGGLFFLYALLFLLGAGAAGLAIVFPVWLALLVVGGGALFLGAMLAGVGALGLRGSGKVVGDETAEEVEERPWLRAKTS
jgi:hypothetical protein